MLRDNKYKGVQLCVAKKDERWNTCDDGKYVELFYGMVKTGRVAWLKGYMVHLFHLHASTIINLTPFPLTTLPHSSCYIMHLGPA